MHRISRVDTRAKSGLFVFALLCLGSLLTACFGNSHPNRVNSITLSPGSGKIAVGQTLQFNGTATTNSGQTLTGNNAGASWTSSNAAVATVDQNGVATGVGQGTATITATVDTGGGPVTGTATLTVTPAVLASINVSPATPSVATGQTQQFTATGIYTDNSQQAIASAAWSSSSTSVATINSGGLATAVAVGTTTITATANGMSGTTTLTVVPPPPSLVSIAVTPANPSVTSGSTQQFMATASYSDGSTQTLSSANWASSASAVATIDANGFATAGSVGATTITATASGISGSTGMTVTAASSNTYIGTQSPGDLWTLTVDDAGDSFTAMNLSTTLSYQGTFATLPNGFYSTTITSSSDPNLPAGTNGYALEVPGVALVISLGGSSDQPIASIVPGPCPIIANSLTGDLINLGKSTYDSTSSESYAVVTGTQTESDYNFTVESYLLDGTLRASQSGPLPSPGTCSNGVITVPNIPDSSGGTSTTTAVAAPNGLYVLDLGRDSLSDTGKGGAVGTTTNIGSSGISSALGLNYLGFLFKRNSSPITTFVGFGPGSGTSITGGSYANPTTDPFSAHGTDVAINLSGTNSNGFLQGTVTDSNGTHTPFVAVITNSGGKYFLFGITTDTNSTQPYAIVLVQQ
jgi:trimeric autotransporter adhesin